MCYGNDIMPLRRVLGVGDYLVFVKRKNANLRDYQNMPTIVDLFDAFVKNESPDSSALTIKNIFDGISLGESVPTSDNEKIAKMLSEITTEKQFSGENEKISFSPFCTFLLNIYI